MLALGLQAAAQEGLLPAFRVGMEEAKAGNPLFAYTELNRLEEQYLAANRGSEYWQAKSTIASYLGDYRGANHAWDMSFQNPQSPQIMRESPLAAYEARDAVDYVVEQADKHNWIMLGEEHVKPQSRSIMIPLLRKLYAKGFRTLAVETFNADIAEQVRETPYPTHRTGTYTADPVFAAGIREAVRLGFRLVPYESVEMPADIQDPNERQNYRERKQAENLKERIFDADPNAKVVVWAGRAHVYEESADMGGAVWTPMAHVFKQITGVDPLSVYLATYLEDSEPKYETSLYRWAADHRVILRPTVFVSPEGTPYGDPFDVQVFFPRPRMIGGRPDWLARELGRKTIPMPSGLVRPTGYQLVQAFAEGEPELAIPVDQILIQPGAPVPGLVLPEGRYWVRCISPTGEVLGRTELEVR